MRTQTITLSISSGVVTFGMGLLAAVLPAYAQSLGASAALVGLLLASFGIARLLASLPAAWLARRVGERRMLVGSPAIIAPIAALCALPGGLWALALLCTAEGAAATAFATVSVAAIVGDAGPERRGRSLAGYQSAGLLGAALGPAVGGTAAQLFGARAAFLLYAVLAALVAVWLHWRLDWPSAARSAAPAAHLEPASRPAGQLLIDPRLLALWPIAFALIFTRIGVQLVIAPLLGAGRLGQQPQGIGLALSLSSFAALAAFYPAGALADRYGRSVAIVLGGLGMAGALALFAVSESYAAFVGAALLLGAGSGLIGPAPAAYLADVVPARDRATGVGMYRTLGDLGATLAPPLLGWVADRSGYGAALLVAGAPLLIAASVFAWLAPATQPAGSRFTR